MNPLRVELPAGVVVVGAVGIAVTWLGLDEAVFFLALMGWVAWTQAGESDDDEDVFEDEE